MRVGPVQSSRTLNLGTFQFKLLQGGDLSKADKNFCPVSVRFIEVPLYLELLLLIISIIKTNLSDNHEYLLLLEALDS